MNQLYDRARELFLGGELNWRAGFWRLHLLNAGYVFDPEHSDMARHLSPLAVIASSPLLTGLTIAKGVAGCDPVSFGLVTSRGAEIEGVLLARDGDGLMVWHGDEGFGLPLRVVGRELVVYPDATFGGLFRL